MRTILYHIGRLWQYRRREALETALRGEALKQVPYLDNAYLIIDDGRIVEVGPMEELGTIDGQGIDLKGRDVTPCWVDCHTHLVFAAPRLEEFRMRLAGMSYEEIAARGGGIYNSALRLREMPEEELYQRARRRLDLLIRMGTGAVEIKSGYGLDTDSELKMLRVIDRLKRESPIPVRATFLGAHAIPPPYRDRREKYLEEVLYEMVPRIAEEQLAAYIDVFCERGYFTAEETEQIILQGAKYGLKARLHTNQFSSSGGIEVAVRHRIVSVDHLEVLTEEEIHLLSQSEVMATLLPGAAFFLRSPYPKGRALVDSGARLALASDYNPGSCPTPNMFFVQALACLRCGLTPEEAFNAATVNAAYSLDLQGEVGAIAVGARANLLVFDELKDLAQISYEICNTLQHSVIINGKWYGSNQIRP